MEDYWSDRFQCTAIPIESRAMMIAMARATPRSGVLNSSTTLVTASIPRPIGAAFLVLYHRPEAALSITCLASSDRDDT